MQIRRNFQAVTFSGAITWFAFFQLEAYVSFAPFYGSTHTVRVRSDLCRKGTMTNADHPPACLAENGMNAADALNAPIRRA